MKLKVPFLLILTSSIFNSVIRAEGNIDLPAVSLPQEASLPVKQKTQESITVPSLSKVNGIRVVIYTQAEPIIITKLDLDRRSLDGRQRTKEEVILDHLLYHEATVSYKMNIPEDMVKKHILSIKEMHGISESQIADLFMREGYTFEEGKQQLRMSYAIQGLTQQFITSRLVVTEKEILTYHKKHPITEQASFRIQKGYVDKKNITENEVKQLVADGLYRDKVEWTHPYWLDKNEVPDSRKFILSMNPGQVHVIPGDDKYEVFMLVKRKQEHVKTLNEARAEMANQIRMPKYEKMLAEFHKSVLDKYEIVDMTL